MTWKSKLQKLLLASLLFISVIIALYAFTALTMPHEYAVFEDSECVIENNLPITLEVEAEEGNLTFDNANGSLVFNTQAVGEDTLYNGTVKLFGLLPVKDITFHVMPRVSLAPCGITAGVKMITDGVMVVGMNDIKTDAGKINPSYDAGIRIKDVIISANGEKLRVLEDLMELLSNHDGEPISLEIRRRELTFTAKVTPYLDGEQYRLGMWVRDSAAGIGTVTFVDTASGIFGGLGHAICDVDTGEIMTVSDGILQRTLIKNVQKGEIGSPGELQGIFADQEIIGELANNNAAGIYGVMKNEFSDQFRGKEMPIALKNEIKTGKATILSNIEEDIVEEYEIQIVKINKSASDDNRNMMIEVTDERLLNVTGGIVQGMSGSPIMQDGKIIGAVTHVLVNDPKKGYAIFIENMLKNIEIPLKTSGGINLPSLTYKM